MRGAWGTEPERLDAVETALRSGGEGPAVVLVEGALGTGKSTLLDGVAARQRGTGPVVLRARAARGERELPLGVVRQLLHGRPDTAGAPPLPADGASAEAVGWHLAGLAESRPEGVLLLVDDAEHADDATLAALEALALRRPRRRCGVLLATARAGARPALVRLQAGGSTVRLGPLPPGRGAQLVRRQLPEASPAHVADYLRITGGIPLLLAVLLAQPPEPGTPATAPEPLLRRVRAELTGLSPAARLVADAVAVLGPGVSLADARGLTGLDRRAVGTAADELAAAGLLRPDAPLIFAQPLLATAVHAAIPPHARSALHRAAAQLLASQCAAADVVDAHLLRTFPSGEPWVAERLVQAAHRAEDRHERAAVVGLLARAAAEPPPLPSRAPVLVALAAAKMALGDASAASELEQALRLPAAPGLAAHARTLLAQLHHLRGRTGDGLSVLEESLPSGEDGAAGPLLGRFLTLTGLDARYRARVEPLVAPLVAAARAGQLPADPGLAAHVAWRLAVDAAPAEVVAACAERALAADPLVEPATQGDLLGFAVRALLAVDRVAAAERACTRALESARARGLVFGVGYARYHRALARLAAGALDGALADVLGAAEPARRGWTRAEVWRCELTARIHLARGETAAARQALALAPPAPATSLCWAFARAAEARSALAEDRPGAAADLAARAGECLAALGQDVPALLPWRLTVARAARREQRTEEARALAAQALARARAHPSRIALGSALVTAGVVAPPELRVPLLREACATLAGTPGLLERAEALIALGRALRQAGCRAEARGPLREALDLALPLSAGPLVQTARAELAAAGARPRRDRLRGPAALTASERRVADLALAGRTNAGIGGELSIGRKTVETHLAQVYRKLGISGRGELAGALGAP